MKNKIIKSILFTILITNTFTFAAAKKSIVCVSFPEYDWVMNILGEHSDSFNVFLLQNNGTDLHSYQPSFKDIATISQSDFFVYVGGESDAWVEKALANATNENKIVINMMKALGDKVKVEEIVEGMQSEEEMEAEVEIEYDEHIWLSIKNAIYLTKIFSENIQKLDPKNSSFYEQNATNYINKLRELDSEYSKTVDSAKNKTILLADRYPFRYLSDDYKLKYYAAFVGCSAESEASFDTIIFLSKKVDELGLNVILTLEKNDKKMAKTIISSTKNKNQQILELDSLQSITLKEIKAGRNYLSAMNNNLEVLKKALN